MAYGYMRITLLSDTTPYLALMHLIRTLYNPYCLFVIISYNLYLNSIITLYYACLCMHTLLLRYKS